MQWLQPCSLGGAIGGIAAAPHTEDRGAQQQRLRAARLPQSACVVRRRGWAGPRGSEPASAAASPALRCGSAAFGGLSLPPAYVLPGPRTIPKSPIDSHVPGAKLWPPFGLALAGCEGGSSYELDR